MDRNDIIPDGIDGRIDTFLQGRMSPEEEAAFKQEIKDNPELRNRVLTATSLVRELLLENKAKEKAILGREEAKRVEKPYVARKRSRVRPILWWTCSVAAVVVVFFGVYKELRLRTLDSALSPYYTQYSIGEVSRGEVDSVAVAHLFTLFSEIQENRRMPSLIDELEPIYQSLAEDITYQPWANDIAWNLALAYVKDDQIEKAVTILEKIKQENQDMPISAKAEELITKLKSL